MLTITTTGTLDALRRRADQAETDVADANRQLEELQQQREMGQDQPDAPTELAALRDELAAARWLADEALASEARTKSVCDVMVKDASAQLAARDRTIAELRAELEHARTTWSAAEPELPKHTVLRFRTVGGGLAVVTGEPTTYYCEPLDKPVERPSYAWQCLTCADSSGGYTTWDRDDMRRRANEHAAECRAIPAAATRT